MRSILLVVVALSACGNKETNALDLAQVEGMPVRLTNVRMVESRYASLGGGSVTISSGDGPNAIGIAYDVHVVGQAAQHSGVSAQLACRVGEHTIVSRLATDASNQLAASAVGAKLDGHETFPPTPFGTGIPTVCEATLWYTIAPPLAAVPRVGDAPPERTDERHGLGTVCFADGKLVEGACAPDVLPRVPAAAPIEITRVTGRIGDLQGGGHGLQIAVLATAGEGLTEQVPIGTEARCKAGNAVHEVPVPMFMHVADLRPGESTWHDAATPSGKGLPTPPESCTVDIMAVLEGEKRMLAQWCVRGDRADEGGCD